MRGLLSTEELAEYLQVPVPTIYTWRQNGQGPPAIKVGRHLRFRYEDVFEWVQSHRDEQVPA